MISWSVIAVPVGIKDPATYYLVRFWLVDQQYNWQRRPETEKNVKSVGLIDLFFLFCQENQWSRESVYSVQIRIWTNKV